MARTISIRDAGKKYRVLALVEGRWTHIGRLSKDTLSYTSEYAGQLTPETKSELKAKLQALEALHRAQTGVMILALMQQLTEFQKSLGLNGPGDVGLLFDDLEEALRTTLKKVQRVNELAVRGVRPQ